MMPQDAAERGRRPMIPRGAQGTKTGKWVGSCRKGGSAMLRLVLLPHSAARATGRAIIPRDADIAAHMAHVVAIAAERDQVRRLVRPIVGDRPDVVYVQCDDVP